jgi:hypothetical protein
MSSGVMGAAARAALPSKNSPIMMNEPARIARKPVVWRWLQDIEAPLSMAVNDAVGMFVVRHRPAFRALCERQPGRFVARSW